jgi:DNA ligase (NAD+)
LEYDLVTVSLDLPYPPTCPSCKHPTVVSLPHLVCPNPSCRAKLVFLLAHVAKRPNFDIGTLGEEVAEALVASGLVKNLYDLFTLEEAKVASIPFGKGTYGSVRAKKLVDNIDKAREKPWNVVLHSLGIPGLGEPECDIIAAKYSLWDLAVAMNPAQLKVELMTLKGMGEKTAVALAEWLKINRDWLVQYELTEAGGRATGGLITLLNTRPEVIDSRTQPLLGYKIVLTGSFSTKSARSDYEKRLKKLGAEVPGSVSANTTYLVAGANVGANKTDAAKKHGVNIIDEATLIALLKEHE